MTPTPVMPFTRIVLVVGFALTAGTGIGLSLLPDRTEDYWAWTIRAPLSAALFGAGYVGAAIGLGLALREREWQRIRVIVVAAATLTSLSLVVTLRHLDMFAFDADAWLPRAVAWPVPELPSAIVGAWLLTYATAFVWLALRERDWRRSRIGVPTAAAFAALQLGAVVRYSDDLAGGVSAGLYVGSLVAALVAFVAVAWHEEAAPT